MPGRASYGVAQVLTLGRRQEWLASRRGCVRTTLSCGSARYDMGVRDVVFMAIVVGFFAVATLFVRGCDLVVGPNSDTDAEHLR